MVSTQMDRRLASRVDPSDVVQEAMIEAHRLFPEYLVRRPVAFYPWLKKITTNRLIDLHRRHLMAGRRTVRRESPQRQSSKNSSKLLADQLLTDDHAAARLIRDELRDRVQSALEQLPTDLREVLVLRHLERMSVAEVSRQLRIPEGTVRSRQFRALAQLRQLLDRGSSEPST
jgi:RNA polymerase sigma-70 factor (ECF subfamily)